MRAPGTGGRGFSRSAVRRRPDERGDSVRSLRRHRSAPPEGTGVEQRLRDVRDDVAVR